MPSIIVAAIVSTLFENAASFHAQVSRQVLQLVMFVNSSAETASELQSTELPTTTQVSAALTSTTRWTSTTATTTTATTATTATTGHEVTEHRWLENTFPAKAARSKIPCPTEASVTAWNGRLGNHLQQVMNVLAFAQLCGVESLQFPAHQNNTHHYSHQIGLLEMPRQMQLSPEGGDRGGGAMVPKGCPHHWHHPWFGNRCRGVPMWFYRRLSLEHVRPYLGEYISSCLSRPEDPEENLLTIHIRGDDVQKYPEYMWAQPPCSMYEKIILDNNFTEILLVQKGNTTCSEPLLAFAKSRGIRVRSPQEHDGSGVPPHLALWMRATKNMAEDFCMLMRARHLVLSFSTFALSAALLSTTVRTLYRRREAPWDSLLYSPANCNVWQGVTLFDYGFKVPDPRSRQRNASEQWLKGYALSDVAGPKVCGYGSKMDPL
ncbi:unnamed protein product [Effrenium voratum]|uniref:Fucosyltransferase n=1 Tax=Effrenium voratum TaxID=2562239 RepID=A0AA36N6Z9_9DINO|nr:unnamed protein product [Effrenium voratum]